MALLSLIASGCSLLGKEYFASEAMIRFVDSETGAPLEDVVVLTYWQLHSGHNYPRAVLELYEVTTNEDGWATIPGWGPTYVEDGGGQLTRETPKIIAHKTGYSLALLQRHHADERSQGNSNNVTTRWHNQTFTLRPIADDDKELYSQMEFLSRSIRYQGEGCEWAKVPRSYLTLVMAVKYFDARNIAHRFVNRQLLYSPACEEIAKQYKEYWEQ